MDFEKFAVFSKMIGQNIVEAAQDSTPFILEGLRLTLMVSISAIIIGIVIGLFACLMRLSKWRVLRWIASAYIWAVRGTPMIVQAFFIHFGVSEIIRIFLPSFVFTAEHSAIITASINAGAYLAEIFRGGINAVPKGQMEAARSLGMGYGKTMQKVILPQAIKITIPSMVNQFIITIKDTSILSVIGLAEMTNKTKAYVGASYNTFGGWFYVGFFYLALISILMIISKKVEEKYSYGNKK